MDKTMPTSESSLAHRPDGTGAAGEFTLPAKTEQINLCNAPTSYHATKVGLPTVFRL